MNQTLRNPILRWSAIAVALGLTAAGIALSLIDPNGRYQPRPLSGQILEFVLFLGGLVCVTAGALLWSRRSNRCGPLLVALGACAGLLQGSYYAGPSVPASICTMVALLGARPVTGWLLLSWPSGRLRLSDRRALIGFTALTVMCNMSGVLFEERSDTARLVIVEVPAFSNVMGDIANYALFPVGSVLLLSTLVRRRRAMSAPSRGSVTPAVWAAVVAVLADVVANWAIPLTGVPTSNSSGLNAIGLVQSLLALGRYLFTGLVLAWAIRRRLAITASPTHRIDIGPAETAPEVAGLLAARTGDAAARVLYPSGDHWLDPSGNPASVDAAPGRTVNYVYRNGRPVAAFDLDSAFDDRPSVIEVAAATTGTWVEHERLQALALARLTEVRQARTAVVEAEDTTRRRLERDLHDGAQQQLVGLALKARLAAQSLTPDPTEVADIASGLVAARRDIEAIAQGIMPAVLAEHGLSRALSTLAVTTPLGVTIDVDLPDDLHPALASAIWFVITEAVTNAAKHARASALSIRARMTDVAVEVHVTDDGVGGAEASRGSGLTGLRDRVAQFEGSIAVISPVGQGTQIDVVLPLGGFEVRSVVSA